MKSRGLLFGGAEGEWPPPPPPPSHAAALGLVDSSAMGAQGGGAGKEGSKKERCGLGGKTKFFGREKKGK